MLTVLVADDSEIIRKAISRLLMDCPEVKLVAEASNHRQMTELISMHHPAIVIMDVHMMGEVVMTIPELKVCLSGSQLLVTSLWNDAETMAIADALGAVKFLDKSLLGRELIPTLQKIAVSSLPE
jgi:DNA-binding NarL/FixJ family response regulator